MPPPSPKSVLLVFSRKCLQDFPKHPDESCQKSTKTLDFSSSLVEKEVSPMALRLKHKGSLRKMDCQLSVEERRELATARRERHLAVRRTVAERATRKVWRALDRQKMRTSSTAFATVARLTSAEDRRQRFLSNLVARAGNLGTQAVLKARKLRQQAALKKREAMFRKEDNALFAGHKYLEQRGQGLRLRCAESRQRFAERLRSKRSQIHNKLERAFERRAAALDRRAGGARASTRRGREALLRRENRLTSLAARINKRQNKASLKRSTAVAARRLAGAAKRAAARSRWMKRVSDLTDRIERKMHVAGARRAQRLAERKGKGEALGSNRVAAAIAQKYTESLTLSGILHAKHTHAATRRASFTEARVSGARKRAGAFRRHQSADRNSADRKAALANVLERFAGASERRRALHQAARARAAALGTSRVVKCAERAAAKAQEMWSLLELRVATAVARRAAILDRHSGRAHCHAWSTRVARAHIKRERALKAAVHRLNDKLQNAQVRRADIVACAAARAERNERRRAWARGFSGLRSAALARRVKKKLQRATERRAAVAAARPRRAPATPQGLEALAAQRARKLELRLMRAAINRAGYLGRVKERARGLAKPSLTAPAFPLTEPKPTWEAKQERAQLLRAARLDEQHARAAQREERRTRVSTSRVEKGAGLAERIQATLEAAAAKRNSILKARRASPVRGPSTSTAAAAAVTPQLQAWRAADKARASQENAAKRRRVSTRSKKGGTKLARRWRAKWTWLSSRGSC